MSKEDKIDVVDLTEEHEKLYFVCLEDWSDEFKEVGDHKEVWYDKMKEKGLRVKLAKDENGNVGGMIQYLPIEHSFADGNDLFLIKCIWVHGYKKGRGNFQKKGMGISLIQAAEEDVKNLGAKGIVAWGIPLPFWMKASWFKKQGYTRVDKLGFMGPVLLWKPFSNDASPPSWIKPKKKPGKIPGQVTVSVFINGWCPAQSLAYERAKRASEEFGPKVVFVEYRTLNREVFLEWGISDALYVDGRKVRTGPPPSYEKIKKIIAQRVKKM